jgi:hypothetical protein
VLVISYLSKKRYSAFKKDFIRAGNLENVRYTMICVLHSVIYIYIYVCVCVCVCVCV